jgi:hypothetical protein
VSDTPRTSAWWREKVGTSDLYGTMWNEIIEDLAASERSDAIHLEALAESERLRVKTEEWRDELDTECTNRQLRIYELEKKLKALMEPAEDVGALHIRPDGTKWFEAEAVARYIATLRRELEEALGKLAAYEADAREREKKAFMEGWLMKPLLHMANVEEEAFRRYGGK